jgi:hemoglobin
MKAELQAKPDLEPGAEVQRLVDTFYDGARKDPVLGPVFNKIIGDDWSSHLPVMYSFWDSVVFGLGGYKGQAVAKHIDIDRQIPLEAEHFRHWITRWNATVDGMFAGPNAELAKSKANMMLQLIKFKVDYARSTGNKFIQ